MVAVATAGHGPQRSGHERREDVVTLDRQDVLTPRFGLRYIGYPAAGLVGLVLLVATVSVQSAMGLLMLALGYVSVGAGFVITLVYYRRFNDVP